MEILVQAFDKNVNDKLVCKIDTLVNGAQESLGIFQSIELKDQKIRLRKGKKYDFYNRIHILLESEPSILFREKKISHAE